MRAKPRLSVPALLFSVKRSTLRLMPTELCWGDSVLERWQNGIALASKASARKGLGVRIPRAPFSKGKPLRSLGLGGFSFLEGRRGMRAPVRAEGPQGMGKKLSGCTPRRPRIPEGPQVNPSRSVFEGMTLPVLMSREGSFVPDPRLKLSGEWAREVVVGPPEVSQETEERAGCCSVVPTG